MIMFALDTNTISYMLKRDEIVVAKHKHEVNNGNDCIIPPMVYYEIKRGLLAKNAEIKTKSFDRLCGKFGVGEMNADAWDKAAQLYAIQRKQGRTIEDADLLIAAFCIVNGYTLVTNNTKHFSLIDGLQITDWKQQTSKCP